MDRHSLNLPSYHLLTLKYNFNSCAQLIFASGGGNPQGLPNEDSTSFEFDATNLFSPNPSPGYDLWTGGTMGIEGGLAGLAGPLVGIALVVFLFRRRQNEARRLSEPIPT